MPADKGRGGRPSSYRDEYAAQAEKMAKLGATDAEMGELFALDPTEDEFLFVCLALVREDRRGVIAARKKARSRRKGDLLAGSPSARIRNSVSARMWAALKGRTDGALFSRLGYSAEQLVAHLEAQFDDGMSWANYGRWHVDHVKPCAAFDMTDAQQFAECWSLANLAPLWAEDNVRKGASYGTP